MKEIAIEREEIEKLKKNRNKNQSSKNRNIPSVPADGFSSISLERQSSIQPLTLMNELSEFDLE